MTLRGYWGYWGYSYSQHLGINACIKIKTERSAVTIGSKDIVKMLINDGWFQVRSKGSHTHFKHKSKRGLVTVPHPKKGLNIKTVNSIFKQAGLE